MTKRESALINRVHDLEAELAEAKRRITEQHRPLEAGLSGEVRVLRDRCEALEQENARLTSMHDLLCQRCKNITTEEITR